MQSSTGQHYLGLDHVRAVAALMVFTWHFTHGATGYPVVFEGAPLIFPLALFDEGHTGVALFMVLSGYLFAKLLHGRCIRYPQFFWNRFLRLAPLLILVFLIACLEQASNGASIRSYLRDIVAGFVFPRWPNGGWSITVEMHFYLALPLLLYLTRRWKWTPLAGVAVAVLIRVAIFTLRGDVQDAAYWTIVGRADDFLMGIAAFNFRDQFKARHWLVAIVMTCFIALFWTFDYLGGFYQLAKASLVWIILPTTEAVAYSTLIAYYDSTYRPSATGISRSFSKIGDYSYSIYLLHPFFVFRLAKFIQLHIMDISMLPAPGRSLVSR